MVLLIALVLKPIYVGIATATEAAAFGVVGALVLAAVQEAARLAHFPRQPDGRDAALLHDCADSGRRLVPDAVDGFHRPAAHLAEWISGLGLSPFVLILALMVFYIILGCFIDGISMVVLTMAVILPTIQKAGIDLLWFGIFIVLVVEMAQITPPVGFNLFVLQGMTNKEITYIGRVAFPMFLLMVAAVMLIYFSPASFPGCRGT